MPKLRAFAICPTCAELYPSCRGCSSCGAAVIERDRAVAPAPPAEIGAVEPLARSSAGRKATSVPVLTALSVGVIVACSVLMALVV